MPVHIGINPITWSNDDVPERVWARAMSFFGAVMEGIFTLPGDGSAHYPPLLRRLGEATTIMTERAA